MSGKVAKKKKGEAGLPLFLSTAVLKSFYAMSRNDLVEIQGRYETRH
jgi:hypothetical protein